MRLKVWLFPLICYFGASSISAATLKEVVSDVLETNPIVIERLKNFNTSQEEIGVAKAGYYPTIDIEAGTGKKYTGRVSDDVVDETYSVFQSALVLRQNIFDGFGTTEQVNYKNMQALAAAYSYLEKANEMTLETVNVYIDLQREAELLRNSDENVAHIAKIYDQVSKSFKAGLTPFSEVSKIQSSLSLAKSNKMVQQNKLSNAMFNFRRVTGKLISLESLQRIRSDIKLPKNLREASIYALEYNPSILVGKYNIKGAEALYRESKSKYLPKVGLEVGETYSNNFDDYIGKDDRFQAMLVVSYNLFNGGADEANRRSKISKLNQEVAVVDDLKREVVQQMDLSWSSYELAQDQIPLLEQYRSQSAETLKLYTQEFEMGDRSLLDLLAAENDLNRANAELIDANYNLLYSKYRILDAMGLTTTSIVGNIQKYYQRVGLCNQNKIIPSDMLPAGYSEEESTSVDRNTLCPSSGGKDTFGCSKSVKKLDTVRLNNNL